MMFGCGCCKTAIRPEVRTVYVGNHPPSYTDVYVPERFPDNRVISSKYTLWNFLPKNLFEQFQRIANFYFLCMVFIQLIIESPVSPVTSIIPLLIVVSVTAVKQGYEDRLRHVADNEVNNRPAFVLREGILTEVKSMAIKVGDIVRVQTNHGFPCDMVMLSSHDPEGVCYVTTANLDGETNLKAHSCVVDTRKHQSVEELDTLNAVIECEQPIADLYSFKGRIKINSGGETVVRSLGPENVLLRGARLKNTPYVYGCAIYTGQETKMALNSEFKKTKISRVERSMNIFLIVFLVLLLLEAGLCTGLKYWFEGVPELGQPWYIPPYGNITAKAVIQDFFAFLVLFNYVIPISLYVTIELQKFVGSLFFKWDIKMYDDATGHAAKANTSDLNEELGQVEYLFTDKTGTLTENDMQFRQCSIKGVRYIDMGGMLCTKPDMPDVQAPPVHLLTDSTIAAVGLDVGVGVLRILGASVAQLPEIEEFLTVLVLCHLVRVDRADDVTAGAASMYSSTGFDYDYTAPSPDEKALVEACRRYGVVYHGIHDDRMEVTFKGEMRRYKPLHVLEFDAVRKRMSVIVQNEKDEVFLLCKGAESAILDRVETGDKFTTLQHVNQYAVLGLRTLCIAQRKLSVEEFEDIDTQLNSARNSLEDREEQLIRVFDLAERKLELLGATAVEDKLQDGVPETIESLRTAGIKVWVLTGDKEETAVNISYSAGHFKQGMMELRVTKQTNPNECGEIIEKHLSLISRLPSSQYALIIDGASLNHTIFHHSNALRNLAQKCVAVLCCRMSPIQKAEVVRLVKTSTSNPVTAAIGDGANDVSMIQEAHVGLGIMGKEGRQAVRNSDYAFVRFRFLNRALLVHGHYYYIRIANLVQYFFYKNVAFITAQVYYAFFSAFSEQSIFDSFVLMFYNLTYTSLPILIYGIFEQHISSETLLRKPELYKKIARNEILSAWNFTVWNLIGLWHSIVFFFGVFLLFADGASLFPSGEMMGNFSFGALVITVCVLTVDFKLCLMIYHWSPPIVISLIFGLMGFFVVTMFYNAILWPKILIEKSSMYSVLTNVLSSGTVWLSILLLMVIALLPDIVMRAYHDTFHHPDRWTKKASLEPAALGSQCESVTGSGITLLRD
ncbi:phospholipid-transporting ATPase IF-like [Liolophura sinensis]|uniref:phospholipid-transporting ATPase IF-like n=1 Tax=Liolophura sinensis TaxID=3198878 RepID=UPI0031588DBB